MSLQQTACAYDCYEDSICQVAHDHVWYLGYSVPITTVFCEHFYINEFQEVLYFSETLLCNVFLPYMICDKQVQ